MQLRRRSLAIALLLASCDTNSAPPRDGDEGGEGDGVAAELDARVLVRDASAGDARQSEPLDARVRDGGDEAVAADASEAVDGARGASQGPDVCKVGPVPSELRMRLGLDAFYRKHADADGLPVLGSNEPDDASLVSACQLVRGLLRDRKDVRDALIASKARFAIIGKDEGTAEIPEYGYRERSQADRDQINQRARGLGGQVASCGEENILCLAGDRYRDESICVHEFAHTISTYGVFRADRTFERRLQQSYDAALRSGILEGTYRKESVQEYWAEGVQDWYDTNASARPSNGIHNEVDTRPELEKYDPTLYRLVEEVFPAQLDWTDCHAS